MSNYKENAAFVKKFLDEDDWHYEANDHGSVATVTGGIGGFKGLYNSYRFILFVGDDELQNYAMLPASAKDKLPEMAEFITRALTTVSSTATSRWTGTTARCASTLRFPCPQFAPSRYSCPPC